MNEKIFINHSLDESLNKYELFKKTKDYSYILEFKVYLIGLLLYIYNDSNLLDLYKTKDIEGFNNALLKYGLSKDDINKYYSDYEKYANHELKNKALQKDTKNPYFNYIQEDLINMFVAKYKKLKLKENNIDLFKSLLATENSNSEYLRLMNDKESTDKSYIEKYYNSKIYELENPLDFNLKKENNISDEVYKELGLDPKELNKLSREDQELFNTTMLHTFRFSPIEPNINEKLIKKIKKVNNNNKIHATILKIPKPILFITIFTIIICIAIILGITIMR